ncbi:MAG: FimV/HubP family polar landmark protein, partial [Ghiorsea sp.]|nr:FimV/HubP family polar landmark protein [Ghiorsea sp.]
GDSLSEIAYRLRKDKRWSNQQIMLALFDANPESFINQNINKLKKGHFLKVPDNVAMQQLVNSTQYTTLKALLQPKKIKQQKEKKVSKVNLVDPIQAPALAPLRGRISLGLTESMVAPAPEVNPEVLQRLDKPEPMYQQAMAAGLRLDGMDTKVEALAKELGQLRHKVDALSRMKPQLVQEDVSYAWFWFIALLLLNIVMSAAYFYRKQMKTWQRKLVEAQQFAPQPNVYKDGAEKATHGSKEDNVLPILEPRVAGGSGMEEQAVGLDEYDIMIGGDVSGSQDHQELEAMTIDDMPSMVEEVSDDYVSLFEEAVHKKDWRQAENYYALMDDKESSRPRNQALWVKKLHGSNNVIERNLTLLNLSRVYEFDQWNHFCSYFDQDIWHELQDEKVISYTGKVVESEMDKMNQQLMISEQAMDEADLVVDLSESGRFDITVQDFQTGSQVVAVDPMLETEAEKAEGSADLANDSIVDMGSVDDAELIADIIKGDIEASVAKNEGSALTLDFDFDLESSLQETDTHPQDSVNKEPADAVDGEHDTVIVTPEMIEGLVASKKED